MIDMSFVRERPQGPAAGVALCTASAEYGMCCGRVALPCDISPPKSKSAGLGRGGETKKNSNPMRSHSSSAHSFELLFIKEPCRYGASLTSGLLIMSPSPSTIRLSADYHQC
jgi:hypothetical protein